MKNGIEKTDNFNTHSNDQEAAEVKENSLPLVGFNQGKVSVIEGRRYQEMDITDASGTIIGDFTLETTTDSVSASIADIRLKDTYIGKGFGKATYVNLIQDLSSRGIKLISGSELSRQAIPVWEWLVEKGMAQKVSEGHRDETRQNIGYSNEKYESL